MTEQKSEIFALIVDGNYFAIIKDGILKLPSLEMHQESYDSPTQKAVVFSTVNKGTPDEMMISVEIATLKADISGYLIRDTGETVVQYTTRTMNELCSSSSLLGIVDFDVVRVEEPHIDFHEFKLKHPNGNSYLFDYKFDVPIISIQRAFEERIEKKFPNIYLSKRKLTWIPPSLLETQPGNRNIFNLNQRQNLSDSSEFSAIGVFIGPICVGKIQNGDFYDFQSVLVSYLAGHLQVKVKDGWLSICPGSGSGALKLSMKIGQSYKIPSIKKPYREDQRYLLGLTHEVLIGDDNFGSNSLLCRMIVFLYDEKTETLWVPEIHFNPIVGKDGLAKPLLYGKKLKSTSLNRCQPPSYTSDYFNMHISRMIEQGFDIAPPNIEDFQLMRKKELGRYELDHYSFPFEINSLSKKEDAQVFLRRRTALFRRIVFMAELTPLVHESGIARLIFDLLYTDDITEVSEEEMEFIRKNRDV
jgi:hypothetical protein